MYVEQAIRNPYGVSVFGSSNVRVAPDWVLVKLSASRLAQQPKDAIRQVRDAAQKIHATVLKQRELELRASRVALESTFTHSSGDRKHVGYTAKIAYTLSTRDLEIVEGLLVTLVEAGANEITSVTYQTEMLKEKRAEARRNAVLAAFK